jgi:polysaccharide pyruvyl transferase CsaB
MHSSSEPAHAVRHHGVSRSNGTRVLVAAWIGSENVGDELLFACLRRRLEELGAEVSVISKAPVATEKLHQVRAIDHRDLRALYREITRSHALVFGGGGLLQDGTSLLNLPYHLSRVELARVCRIPFIGMGLGVGPLKFRASSWLVKTALKGHRGLTVRDEASAQLLRQCGLSNIQVTADLALALEPGPAMADDRIVLALRDYSEGLIPARFRARGSSEEMELKLAAALDEIQRRTRLHLRFLAFEGKRDEEFNRRVAARMSMRNFSFGTPDIDTILEEMARGRLTIAMRYHGGITSIVAERPVVLIGYAPKVSALATALGDDCCYLPHQPRAFEELPDLVVAMLGKDSTTLRSRRVRLQDAERLNQKILEAFLLEVATCR